MKTQIQNENTTTIWITKLPVALTVLALCPQVNVNENADFNGRPKTCPVGDSVRKLLSSQHGKHGMRCKDTFLPLVETVENALASACSEAIQVEIDQRSILWPAKIAKSLREYRDEAVKTDPEFAVVNDGVCLQIAQEAMNSVTGSDSKTQKKLDSLQGKITAAEKRLAEADAEKRDGEQKKLDEARQELQEFEDGDGNTRQGNILALGGEVQVIVNLCKPAMDFLKNAAKKGEKATSMVKLAEEAVKAQFDGIKGSLTERASEGGRTVRLYRLLFGNMATTPLVAENRATLCRSHSFSVNGEKASSFIDTLVATDDLAFEFGNGNKGAPHITEFEYASYVMFSFTSWNVRQAAKNLYAECPTFGPKEIGIILEAVASWLVHTVAKGGKGSRESRAPAYGYADTVVVETTMEQPTTPAAAFFKAVPMSGDIRLQAEIALANEIQNLDDKYGVPAGRAALPLNMKGDSPIKKVALPLSLGDLQKWASSAVVNRPFAPMNGKTHHVPATGAE